jgi:hypothetical protein
MELKFPKEKINELIKDWQEDNPEIIVINNFDGKRESNSNIKNNLNIFLEDMKEYLYYELSSLIDDK